MYVCAIDVVVCVYMCVDLICVLRLCTLLFGCETIGCGVVAVVHVNVSRALFSSFRT